MSWRYLSSDPINATFNSHRNGENGRVNSTGTFIRIPRVMKKAVYTVEIDDKWG